MRQKRCKACGKLFDPVRSTQVVCCPECAFAWSNQGKGKQAAEKVLRAVTRARKEAIEKLPDLHKKAQAAFNRFIRLRDQGKPCVSCGRPLPPLGSKIGGAYDCGHFRSVGRAGHLRYTEDNCAGQCKDCNIWGSGAYQKYREELTRRIGEARVIDLEQDNAPHKWTKEEVREVIKTYRAKCREIEKAMR